MCASNPLAAKLAVISSPKGKAEPYRLKFRRPSFVNLQILPKLLVGETMTNLITILGGIDIVVGEVDC